MDSKVRTQNLMRLKLIKYSIRRRQEIARLRVDLNMSKRKRKPFTNRSKGGDSGRKRRKVPDRRGR